MPEVIIKARNEWFPADMPENTYGADRRHTNKQHTTLAIARQLPRMVADAFNEVCGEKLGPDQVVFDIHKYHSLCSDNQPNISITISPSLTPRREARLAALLVEIRQRVMRFLTDDCGIAPGSPNFPAIDIMIKFVIEAGEALNNEGKVTSTW